MPISGIYSVIVKIPCQLHNLCNKQAFPRLIWKALLCGVVLKGGEIQYTIIQSGILNGGNAPIGTNEWGQMPPLPPWFLRL